MGYDRRSLALLLAVAAVYVVAGKLGLLVASIHVSASPVWPPTGIAIAALLLYGLRLWPAIAVGAFVVNVTNDGHVPSSLGIAAGNTLEAVTGAYLTTRFANGVHAFVRPGTLLRFVGAALVACAVSATIGVTSLELTGLAAGEEFVPVWTTWWLGDLGGALVVAPFVVLWGTRAAEVRHGGGRVELVALLVSVAGIAAVVFGSIGFGPQRVPVAFLLLPVLVWSAFRFGPRIAATTVALIAGLAVWGTLEGTGPFIRGSANESLLLLQSFMGVASITTLALAAGVLERQEAEERLQEFLSIAAHELRTPVVSVQLGVQYLVRAIDESVPDTVEVRRTLGVLDSQVTRLGQLIGQLLDTVRLDSGRIDLEIHEHDLAALVRRYLDEARESTGRHEIVLSAPETLRVPIDELRMERVLRNLVDNAVKFSPAGGRIDVSLAEQDGRAIFAVRDRGVGVAPEHRAHLFDRFYQGLSDQRAAGLGLGLYLSRHIVELHGGRIEAQFPHDGGTRIVVDLPRGDVRKEQA